jgi:predicted DNA-binding transcriptional regulator YafY
VRVVARKPTPDTGGKAPDPEVTAVLVQGCASARRLRLTYATGPGRERSMEVEPWAVAVRYGKWYLLCWSRTVDARRLLRVDRIVGAELLADAFAPPVGLDPLQTIEEHLSESWRYEVEVLIDAPADTLAQCVPRSLGRLEAIDAGRTRLTATTDEPDWYAEQLAAIHASFRVVRPRELHDAVRALGERLLQAADPGPGPAGR